MTREEAEAPKSFVVVRGTVTKFCKFLRDDLRLIFNPFTAVKLRERKANSLKDFQDAAIEFGVTHLITLSQSDITGTMLRLIRLPKGPTFWFRVSEFSLIQDIVSLHYPQFVNTKKFKTMKQNKSSVYLPDAIQSALHFAPLVILNGFGRSETREQDDGESERKHNRVEPYHKQLMSVMFKHMFAPMNVIKMKLSQCKRVVFFNYDSENDCVQVRHYRIQLASDLKGVSKGIKKIIKPKRVRRKTDGDNLPDLSGYDDVTDYVQQNQDEHESESEVDDDDEHTKVVYEKMRDSNVIGEHTSFVRLQEIGPRMSLELMKIEELVNDGKVLYHRYIQKSEEERRELQERKDRERKLKEERRIRQELNVKRKEEMKKQAEMNKEEKRKQKEVAKLLESFELKQGDEEEEEAQTVTAKSRDDKSDRDNSKKRKRGILKKKSGDGQPKKKRVRF